MCAYRMAGRSCASFGRRAAFVHARATTESDARSLELLWDVGEGDAVAFDAQLIIHTW